MKTNKTQIEVCQRLMDYWIDSEGQKQPKYHAQIKGESGVWSCGRTQDEAIGNLVRSHSEKFGIKVVDLGKLPR